MSTMDDISRHRPLGADARAEAKLRNEQQKKIAAERLKKNAEYNKAHKPSKTKKESS